MITYADVVKGKVSRKEYLEFCLDNANAMVSMHLERANRYKEGRFHADSKKYKMELGFAENWQKRVDELKESLKKC